MWIYNLAGAGLFLVVVAIIAMIVFFFIMVGWMAQQRGRSVGGWIAISLFLVTPVLATVFLFFLGDTDERRRQKLFEDEEYIKKLRD